MSSQNDPSLAPPMLRRSLTVSVEPENSHPLPRPPPLLKRTHTVYEQPPDPMDAEYPMSPPLAPEAWLNENWPAMKRCDVNWTFERYDYPPYVRNWIKKNWVKVSDDGGGTYEKPGSFQEREYMLSNGEDIVTVVERVPVPMDDRNAAAAAVMATDGMDVAVNHMFTREDGSTRSYAEMRALYG